MIAWSLGYATGPCIAAGLSLVAGFPLIAVVTALAVAVIAAAATWLVHPDAGVTVPG